MDEKLLQEVFSDEAFVTSLLEMDDSNDVQKALSDKGIKLSITEIDLIRNQLAGTDEELNEDELENVAGGVSLEAIEGVVTIVSGLVSLGDMLFRSIRRRRW